MIAATAELLSPLGDAQAAPAGARRSFESHDGTRLYYRRRSAALGAARGAVVLLHGAHGDSALGMRALEALGLLEFDAYAWDARAVRRAQPTLGSKVKDVDCFVRHVAETSGVALQRIAVIGEGEGALLACAWVHDYAAAIRALVLCATAFRARAHTATALALPVRALLERDRMYRRLLAGAHALELAVQVLVPALDWVVQRRPQFEFYERLGSERKELHLLTGLHHGALAERDGRVACGYIRPFVERAFARTPTAPRLRSSGRNGCSAGDLIAASAGRCALRTVGALSAGIRIGLARGFDSVPAREYVYANRAQGATGLHRAIDRIYLSSTGWKALRMRRAHLQRAIHLAAARLRLAELPVHIVDIAVGSDQSVLEAALRLAPAPDSVRLQDLDFGVVEEGNASLRERKLGHVATFIQGDAFDPDGLAGLAPEITIAVAAGLYERFRENALPQRSLAGLAAALPRGGCLVYTGHTRCAYIERVVADHPRPRAAGAPWLRPRPQAELDRMVEQAGLRKLEQWCDDWGAHTVSLAVRT